MVDFLGEGGGGGREGAKGGGRGEEFTIVRPLSVMVVVGRGPRKQEHALDTREAG